MIKLIKTLGTVENPGFKYPRYPVRVECSECNTRYEMNKAHFKTLNSESVCKKCTNKSLKYSDDYILEIITECTSWREFTNMYPHLYKLVVTRESLSNIKSKYRVTSDEFKSLHKKPGIYFLYNGNKIVYIGKSTTDMRPRLLNHKKQVEVYKEFDNAVCYEIRNIADINVLELYFISKYTPEYNTECNIGGVSFDIQDVWSIPDSEIIIDSIVTSKR